MFDSLVPEYDRFNRLGSLGMDVGWRKELAGLFRDKELVLDVGTGTGDLVKVLLQQGAKQVRGVDFSSNMIDAARWKLKDDPRAAFTVARADELPFEPRTFDGITSAFVIRNLHHGEIMAQSMREFFRVLKPGSQMVHLELSRPHNSFLSWGHKAYLKTVLPLIGRVSFGSRWPSGYLEKTIENFPEPRVICQQMRWAGFENVGHYPLSGGIASLYVGWRC
jgi:demethylmenaquinone methyltransferase/2-methoxy-6-polyprenyl-1,4-benzoquinol methylase